MKKNINQAAPVGISPDASSETVRLYLAEACKLVAGPAERALDSGSRFRIIHARKMYEQAGHANFDAFLAAAGVKRSTVYSNMALSETFAPEDMAFGVSKLRLLVQAKFADPKALLREGVPVHGEPNKSVESFSYREFAAWVAGLPPVAVAPSAVAAATLRAVVPLIKPAAIRDAVAS